MDGRANSRESSSSAAAPPKISLPHSLSLSLSLPIHLHRSEPRERASHEKRGESPRRCPRKSQKSNFREDNAMPHLTVECRRWRSAIEKSVLRVKGETSEKFCNYNLGKVLAKSLDTL